MLIMRYDNKINVIPGFIGNIQSIIMDIMFSTLLQKKKTVQNYNIQN